MLSPTAARVATGAALTVGGVFSLPLAALVLDGSPRTENLILPAQLGAMTAAGAGLGALMPAIAGAGASHGRGALIGGAAGLGAALIADAVYFVLLAG